MRKKRKVQTVTNVFYQRDIVEAFGADAPLVFEEDALFAELLELGVPLEKLKTQLCNKNLQESLAIMKSLKQQLVD